MKLVKESFKNRFYVAVPIITQASYKHCWKSWLEYPWSSQYPRENTVLLSKNNNFILSKYYENKTRHWHRQTKRL